MEIRIRISEWLTWFPNNKNPTFFFFFLCCVHDTVHPPAAINIRARSLIFATAHALQATIVFQFLCVCAIFLSFRGHAHLQNPLPLGITNSAGWLLCYYCSKHILGVNRSVYWCDMTEWNPDLCICQVTWSLKVKGDKNDPTFEEEEKWMEINRKDDITSLHSHYWVCFANPKSLKKDLDMQLLVFMSDWKTSFGFLLTRKWKSQKQRGVQVVLQAKAATKTVVTDVSGTPRNLHRWGRHWRHIQCDLFLALSSLSVETYSVWSVSCSMFSFSVFLIVFAFEVELNK